MQCGLGLLPPAPPKTLMSPVSELGESLRWSLIVNLAGPQSSHISEKDTKVKRTTIDSSLRIARIGTLRRQN
jgi:hypothetical protein